MKTELSDERIGVMQLTDTLTAGGLERVAVNLANALPEGRYRSYLCSTRREGPLAELVAPHVRRLKLNRRARFDLSAIVRLAAYIRQNRIQILHAHGTTLFISVVADFFCRGCAIVWHDHYGRHDVHKRPVWLYRPAVRRTRGVIAASASLAAWAREQLHMSAERVWYLPNFVCEPPPNLEVPELPGKPGSRVVCVANLRPQKDHSTLLRAMKVVVRQHPEAHLLLLGQGNNDDYQKQVMQQITQGELAGKVSWLGSRQDVTGVLRGCDIGVLSSVSEGLPLVLLEYSMAGLATVATRVGQCEEVLDGGRSGLLVPPGAPDEFARAILALLCSPEQRATLGTRFQAHVRKHYSAEQAVGRVCRIYGCFLPTAGDVGA